MRKRPSFTATRKRCGNSWRVHGVAILGGLLLGLVHLGNAWAQATCDSTDTAVTAANPTNAATLAADCSALLAIKDTLRGTASLNWTNTLNMTTWDGIFLTTSRDNVQEIRLSNRSMDGSIPDLSALTSLTAINLSANQLSESIPDLSALTKLTQLYLQNNQLSGSVPDLSALTNLGTLALGGNDLTGSIVAARFPTSLQSLNLRGNQLSGSVPDLSALTNLGTLALGGNDLTGSIVAARFPTSLQSLYLHGNQLSGSIPDLSSLTNLSLLWIHRNELSGSIPATLSALSGLTELHLAGNDLTGSIPSGLGNLANLSQLSLCETDLDSAATLPAALEARRTAVTPSLTVWSCVTLPEDASGPEGTFLAFPVRHSTFPVRGGPGATSVEMPWWTNDGTATSEDYAGRSEDDPGSVTIPANTDTATSTSTATIRVRALVDSLGLEEGEESFTLRLGRPPHNVVGIGDSAIGTIGPTPPPPPVPPPPPPPPPTEPEPEPVPEPMRASFTVDVDCPDDLCRARTDADVRFTDTSSGAVSSRRWTFGDGEAYGSRTVDRAWEEPGFYTVTLAVSDGHDESTASRTFLVEASDPAGTCAADRETLCLQNSRFRVKIDWWTGNEARAAGTVVYQGTDDAGTFSFFEEDNWETLIKVLNGCAVNGHMWVFAASTTDVGHRIEVTDTATGSVREYRNELGQRALAITDSTAFPASCRP